MADIHLHNLGAPYQIVYTGILNILPLQHPQNVKIRSVNLTPINAAISIVIAVESHSLWHIERLDYVPVRQLQHTYYSRFLGTE